MRLSTPRVTPLDRQDWTSETEEVMKRFERPESPGEKGLTDDDIERIAIGPGAEGLDAFDEADASEPPA